MTITINKENPNLVVLSDNTSIYFSSEEFLLKDDTLIIQDGRKSETHWNVESTTPTQSKAVKQGYLIANLSRKQDEIKDLK